MDRVDILIIEILIVSFTFFLNFVNKIFIDSEISHDFYAKFSRAARSMTYMMMRKTDFAA